MVGRRFGMCAALGVVGLATAVADAASNLAKFKTWSPLGLGEFVAPNADGMGMVKVNRDGTFQFTLAMHNLQPNSLYGVMVISDTAPVDLVFGVAPREWFNTAEAFITNEEGDGLYRRNDIFGGPEGEHIVVVVYQWDGVDDPILGGPDTVITEDEARVISAEVIMQQE